MRDMSPESIANPKIIEMPYGEIFIIGIDGYTLQCDASQITVITTNPEGTLFDNDKERDREPGFYMHVQVGHNDPDMYRSAENIDLWAEKMSTLEEWREQINKIRYSSKAQRIRDVIDKSDNS